MKTVVVTGAGTGIGRAVAERLVADGWDVVAVGRRQAPLETIAGARAVAADVSTEAGARAVAGAAPECAALVAAAGGLGAGEGSVRESWQESFESNVLTAVLATEALRPALEQNAGRVVLLSSVAAYRGSGGGPYGAMKAALHAYVIDLARELGEHGGTANAVAPGFVPDTEFWAGRLTDESRAARAALTLVGREGSPEEVASLIAWLVGPEGGWMTAQILSPNGGVVPGR